MTPDITPAKAVSHNTWDQVAGALDRLRMDPLKAPRVPWDSLHDVLGSLWAGEFWVVGASTGNGKSTALMNLCGAWAAEGRRVWVVPLEQPASVMRLHWAAYDLDLPARWLLENNLTAENRTRVANHLNWQQMGAGRELMGFSDAKVLTPGGVALEFDAAQRFGASVLVIDHLNHNGPDPGSRADGYQVLKGICHEILRCNEDIQSVAPGLVTLAAVQLHRDKQGDHLAPFRPPKPSSIEGGEVVRQTCNVAIGLYRPMRETVSKDDELQVRAGAKPLKEILEPGTIGVSVMKHRIRGDVGTIVKLGIAHGKITCEQTQRRLAEEERLGL